MIIWIINNINQRKLTRMESNMKKLHRLAGISILFTLVFMVIALFRYQDGEDMSILPEQVEYYFNENWKMFFLDRAEASGAGLDNYNKIKEFINSAQENGKYKDVGLPYEIQESGSGVIILKNILPEDFAGLTLDFLSNNAIVNIILDGKNIYSSTPAGAGKNISKECFADIPNRLEKGEIWICLEPVYTDKPVSVGGIGIETRDTVVIGIFGNSITDIGCCLLMAIMAIVMFILAVIRQYTHQPSRGEVFIGMAGLASGIYCFIATDTLSIFYSIQKAYVVQEYLVLLFPLFLTMYFGHNFYTEYPRRFTALLLCVIANAVVQVLLQVFGIHKIENMAGISAIVILAVCITAIISIIQFHNANKRFQKILPVTAVIILLSGGIADVTINTVTDSYIYENNYGQYSMTIFCIIMSALHVLQLSMEYKEKAEESTRLLNEKINISEQQNLQLVQAKQEADMAKHEAMAANEAKGKFLAHMSHEIRTPINAVLGMDEMILRETHDQSIKEYAMDIYTAGQTLLSLVNDILDFSKIDSGKMEIVPAEYDISSMVHDVVNMASQRANAKNLNLVADIDSQIPSRLYGDDVRIRQVITNLLANAVKYTHEGTVWFRIKSSRQDGTVILDFEVEDTGIGIKEEDLPKLYAEFERIEENKNRNIEGTGLGISITIQLLGLMGSHLEVESTYGKGSKFYFSLEQKIIDSTPVGDFTSRVSQIAENYNYSSKLYAPDAKILVTDDNAVNRKVLRSLLKETQIQVTEAGSGTECLELVQKNHYDLVLLDHMMPGMDGIETLHHIKELKNFPCSNTPVIVLTANAISGAEEKYISEGFDGFLSKPVVPDKLENIIKEVLPEELVHDTPAGIPDKSVLQVQETGVLADLPEELPQVDGIDWDYAWLHLPDMELLGYTVKEFYSQIGTAADKLEQEYLQITEPGQADNYRIQVHAMKSLAATIGIISLAGTAKILEYAAGNGKTDIIMSLTPVFLDEWRSYQQKLQGVFGIDATEGMDVTDYSVIQALLEMLRASMQEMDTSQADKCMDGLESYKYPDEINSNIIKLADAVTNLNPEETDRIAGLITKQIEELNSQA